MIVAHVFHGQDENAWVSTEVKEAAEWVDAQLPKSAILLCTMRAEFRSSRIIEPLISWD